MTPWQILEIDPTLDLTSIKKAYVKQVKLHHPDHNGNAQDLVKICQAYDQLKNNVRAWLPIVNIKISIPKNKLLTGTIVYVSMSKHKILKVKVPPSTQPGTVMTFFDKKLYKVFINEEL